MKILLICGSTRKKSFNRQLMLEGKAALESLGIEAEVLDYSNVPFFNQDLEEPVLPAVQAARDAFSSADGVWIFTPEYNGQIPGVLKNLLDWMSRAVAPDYKRTGTCVYGKPAALAGAGGGRATSSVREYLTKLLQAIGMKVYSEQTGIRLTPAEFSSDTLADPDEIAASIKEEAEGFVKWIEAGCPKE